MPENLQEHFKQAAEHSYNVCVEHDLNLTQLFRLEFLNFFDINHGKGPVKYTMGIARLAIEPWFAKTGGRFFFFVNGNDGGTYRIRCELNFAEGDNVLFAPVDSQNYRVQMANWDSISNAPKDVQIKANAVLFPQEKVQVVNSFNEMLSRMNKTKNGSILL